MSRRAGAAAGTQAVDAAPPPDILARDNPRPAPSAPRPYAFPRFERRSLSNGVQLVVAPVHKLPIVSVAAVIEAGAMVDPPGKEGLALLTARALAEGARDRDGTALIDAAERLGAALDTSADWDAALVRMTVLTPGLPGALALLGDVLMAPTLPEREIERLKAERLANLLQLRAEPRGLADEMMERFVYAPESRYATPDGGNERSVAGLTRADVVDFYRSRYRPQSVTVVVVGDISIAEAERLVEGVLGKWTAPGGRPGHVRVADRGAPGGSAVHLVTRADALQSELRLAHVGLPRSTPDYFAVTVMNSILGGLFSSRVNLNLREVHAYTYGAHSTFEWRRGAGPFSVSTAVQSASTDAAAREVLLEIERMRETDVSDGELSLATSYLAGVFPIRYETTLAIATALANLVIYGLRDDFYDSYRANIRAQTAADIRRVARVHLHPERIQLVVVGDPGAVRSPLEELGIGPVTVYNDTGETIAA